MTASPTLQHIKGDTNTVSVKIKLNGNYINLESYIFTLTVKKNPFDTLSSALIVKNITVTTQTDTVIFTLNSSDTVNVEAGEYFYDVTYKNALGAVQSIQWGVYKLLIDVSSQVNNTTLNYISTNLDVLEFEVDNFTNAIIVSSSINPVNNNPFPTSGTDWVIGEAPIEAINGVNATYSVIYPVKAGTMSVYLNGLLQKPSSDYSSSGQSITFLISPIIGDQILINYQKQ
jgi:hypothetical protein